MPRREYLKGLALGILVGVVVAVASLGPSYDQGEISFGHALLVGVVVATALTLFSLFVFDFYHKLGQEEEKGFTHVSRTLVAAFRGLVGSSLVIVAPFTIMVFGWCGYILPHEQGSKSFACQILAMLATLSLWHLLIFFGTGIACGLWEWFGCKMAAAYQASCREEAERRRAA